MELDLGTNHFELRDGGKLLGIGGKDKSLGIRVGGKLLGIRVGYKIVRIRVGAKLLGIRVDLSPNGTAVLRRVNTGDNGNAMFQSYLSKLFKKETG